jgi:hypothetical protein
MKRTALKRTGFLKRSGKLPAMSKKRKKDSRVYSQKRKAFLSANPFCEVFVGVYQTKSWGQLHKIWPLLGLFPRSCDIHHKAGRSGTNYLDETKWMAVSREGHDWIHSHPKEARAKGWLL